jgi:predicted aspartyl protease
MGETMRTLSLAGMLSRRQLLGYGAAGSLFLPHGAWAQDATPLVDSTSVAAKTDRANHLTIGVMVEGKGPFQFVVDTGADHSVIADTTAEALGLGYRSKVMVEGVVRTVVAETVRVHDIGFGSIHKKNLVLPILPRAWLQADGYLGLDMIDRTRVTFDFANKKLSINRPMSAQFSIFPRPDEDLIGVSGWHGHLRATNCQVDGVRTIVFIDTGAEISAGNQALFEALNERHPDRYIKSQTTQISGVTGGFKEGRVVEFGRIRIRDLNFTNGTIVIADVQIFDLWGLTSRPALLVGMNFLRQFNSVTIDYGLKEYRFKVASLYVAQNG